MLSYIHFFSSLTLEWWDFPHAPIIFSQKHVKCLLIILKK